MSSATGPGQPSLADIAAPSFAASGSGFVSASPSLVSAANASPSASSMASGVIQPVGTSMPGSAQGNSRYFLTL